MIQFPVGFDASSIFNELLGYGLPFVSAAAVIAVAVVILKILKRA